jgi:hypothetical protein
MDKYVGKGHIYVVRLLSFRYAIKSLFIFFYIVGNFPSHTGYGLVRTEMKL